MSYDVRYFSVPFPACVPLNTFGDYSRLEQRAYRNRVTHETTTRYYLVGEVPGVKLEKELSFVDAAECFKVVCFQNAKTEDKPAIDQLPEPERVESCSGAQG